MNVLFGYEGESARIGDRLSSIRSGETRIYSSFLDPAINDLGARNRAELDSLIAPLSVKTKERVSDHKEALRLRPHFAMEFTSLANVITTSLESSSDWLECFDGTMASAYSNSHHAGPESMMKIVEWVALM